jgi:hypothetical protein
MNITLVNGKKITIISAIVEYNPGLENCPNNIDPDKTTWLLHGLEFSFRHMRLQVFNALDENGVTLDSPSGSAYRWTAVWG